MCGGGLNPVDLCAKGSETMVTQKTKYYHLILNISYMNTFRIEGVVHYILSIKLHLYHITNLWSMNVFVSPIHSMYVSMYVYFMQNVSEHF